VLLPPGRVLTYGVSIEASAQEKNMHMSMEAEVRAVSLESFPSCASCTRSRQAFCLSATQVSLTAIREEAGTRVLVHVDSLHIKGSHHVMQEHLDLLSSSSWNRT